MEETARGDDQPGGEQWALAADSWGRGLSDRAAKGRVCMEQLGRDTARCLLRCLAAAAC